MGAMLRNGVIYISKDLANSITPGERRIILAHEISHWKHKDTIKFLFAKILFFAFPKKLYSIREEMEIRADRDAILTTRDPDSFISLLGKLNRKGMGYPSYEFSIQHANNLRGVI